MKFYEFEESFGDELGRLLSLSNHIFDIVGSDSYTESEDHNCVTVFDKLNLFRDELVVIDKNLETIMDCFSCTKSDNFNNEEERFKRLDLDTLFTELNKLLNDILQRVKNINICLYGNNNNTEEYTQLSFIDYDNITDELVSKIRDAVSKLLLSYKYFINTGIEGEE